MAQTRSHSPTINLRLTLAPLLGEVYTCCSTPDYKFAALGLFFCGVFGTILLDILVHWIEAGCKVSLILPLVSSFGYIVMLCLSLHVCLRS